MRNIDTKEPLTTLSCNEEVLVACRNHIECLQNLAYIVRLNTPHAAPAEQNIDLIEFHLRRLSNLLFPVPNWPRPQAP